MKKRIVLILMVLSFGALAHEHENESSKKTGPDKGILSADEHLGFKLSPEAFRNFGIQSKTLAGGGPWEVPGSAVVRSGEEVNLYRVRDGFIKRIDFERRRESESRLFVSSEDLRSGDDVVIAGPGFLRIAELAVFGGVAEGHSH